MSKKYEIKTIEDVLNCVNEGNIDNFMIDFKKFVTLSMAMKKADKIIGKFLPKEKNKWYRQFNWIDDGKNEFNIDVKIIVK